MAKYKAKVFKVSYIGSEKDGEFTISGRLEGDIDFAVPEPYRHTYQLNVTEAKTLVRKLTAAIQDVEAHRKEISDWLKT